MSQALYRSRRSVSLSWSKRLSRVELSESEPIVSGISRKSKGNQVTVIGIIKRVTHLKNLNALSRLLWRSRWVGSFWISQSLRLIVPNVRDFIHQVKEISANSWWLISLPGRRGLTAVEREWTCRKTLRAIIRTTVQRLMGPDFELIHRLCQAGEWMSSRSVKIHYPDQAKKIHDLGVRKIVVGEAITRPKEITRALLSANSLNEKTKTEIEGGGDRIESSRIWNMNKNRRPHWG